MNTGMRFSLYFIKKLTATMIIVILIILAIFMGYDWANIYVIVNEGLAQRTEVILRDGIITELGKFYTPSYMEEDIRLSDNPYKDYMISTYDLRIKVKKISVWPWNTKAKVVVEETVNRIEGIAKSGEHENSPIPNWDNGEKIITMKKDGRWRIDSVILTKPIKPKDNIGNSQQE